MGAPVHLVSAKSQAGFRAGRSTMDQLFTLRQVTEKHSEKRKSLFCCYIDYQKAFDTVWQDGLWQAMGGYPSKVVELLRALYGISKNAVRVNVELTSWFTAMTGVRQGCTVPQLFNILLELVLRLVIQEEQMGAEVQEQYINNLRLADDIVILVESEEDLQSLVLKVDVHSKKVWIDYKYQQNRSSGHK